jgi:hypothetical protein
MKSQSSIRGLTRAPEHTTQIISMRLVGGGGKLPADSGRSTDWLSKNLLASLNLLEVIPVSGSSQKLFRRSYLVRKHNEAQPETVRVNRIAEIHQRIRRPLVSRSFLPKTPANQRPQKSKCKTRFDAVPK